MKRLLILLALAGSALAQAPVRVIDTGCSSAICKQVFAYSGTTLTYSATANMERWNTPQIWLRRSDSTLTSIAVSSNIATVTCASACGAFEGMLVTFEHATVDTDLNGTYKVTSDTSPSATTFTVTTANVSDATYTDAGLTVSTKNPLLTEAVWTLAAYKYDGSGNLTDMNIWPGVKWSEQANY